MTSNSRFVGAISPQLFLERFMSLDISCPAAPSTDFSKIRAATTVRDVSEALIHAVEKAKLCPNLRLFITKVKKRSLESNTAKPHVDETSTDGSFACVDARSEKADLCAPLAARKQPKAARRTRKRRGLTECYNFATATLGFEIVLSAKEDPFADPEDYLPLPTANHVREATVETRSGPPGTSHAEDAHSPASEAALDRLSSRKSSESEYEYETPFEPDDPDAAATRARILSCAQAHFARQHRCFLFQVVVVSGHARFIRWDRAGAVVSSRFSLYHHSYLAEFLHRFDLLNDQQRGWDSTASLASRRETSLFVDAVRDFLAESAEALASSCGIIPGAEQSLDSSDTFPTWKIVVLNADTDESTEVVVRRPFAGHPALFGRATRAYLAFDLQQRRLVFLKDAWRAHDHRLRPEFQTYQDLRACNIPHIPYPSYGGDVRYLDGTLQTTVSHFLAAENQPWRVTAQTFEGHIHHRLVQELAYPLLTVWDERELMQTIHDALIALDRAYRELGLVHRDLSSLNIMLSRDEKCILSDWDHSGTVEQEARGVGTFQFMSVRLLSSNCSKPNEHVDDLESMFWVLLYVALLRFAVRLDDFPMHAFIGSSSANRKVSGIMKSVHLLDASLYRERFRSKAFTELVIDLVSSWSRYHAAIEKTEEPKDASQSPDAPSQDLEILELAKQPSYWIEKLASAIRKYDVEQRDTTSHRLSDMSPRALLRGIRNRGPRALPLDDRLQFPVVPARGRKRNVASIGEVDAPLTARQATQEAYQPRRSKRLKAMHNRC